MGDQAKPPNVKNPKANARLERVHQVIALILHTIALDMVYAGFASDTDLFLTCAAWAI